ncbi:MAG TPA: histidine kinase [Streptosporangiaceae bacterium]|nr:histidine kinase [Streptosporangiaceae bacterium]
MSALYAWLRRHPRLVDGVLAFALSFSGLAQAIALRRFALVPITLALTVPVVFRRTHPVGAFTVVILVGALQVALGLRPSPADLSIVVLLYTLAAYTTRRLSVTGLGICLLGSAAELGRIYSRAFWTHVPNWLLTGTIVLAGPSLIAWVLGDSMRYRRAYYANLEERAARLERDRDAQARIAAAAERARIARELHDVVAHNVSVMVVQADGATYALGSDPARAREALAAISATGRQALAEMRALLGVLRQSDDATPGPPGVAAPAGVVRPAAPTVPDWPPTPGAPDLAATSELASLTPMPGIEQLDDLFDQTRAVGLAVSAAIEGEPRPLAGGAALAAYRIVQESLTNTRKHAGPFARASVLIRYLPDALELVISDDGVGGAAACDGAGHGLTGMRERAAMYGGSVSAEPAPGGGFRVIARLPAGPVRAGAA